MKGIRFKPDMIKWIQEGIKSTTFRRTRRDGLYQIVKGSWYKPVGLGIFVYCKPLSRITRPELILKWYSTEGDFKTPEEFVEWLQKNKLYKKLPEKGWLNKVDLEIKIPSVERQNEQNV